MVVLDCTNSPLMNSGTFSYNTQIDHHQSYSYNGSLNHPATQGRSGGRRWAGKQQRTTEAAEKARAVVCRRSAWRVVVEEIWRLSIVCGLTQLNLEGKSANEASARTRGGPSTVRTVVLENAT